jgi:hypothetical protein
LGLFFRPSFLRNSFFDLIVLLHCNSKDLTYLKLPPGRNPNSLVDILLNPLSRDGFVAKVLFSRWALPGSAVLLVDLDDDDDYEEYEGDRRVGLGEADIMI